jgi:hypothetical protein
MPVRFGLSTPHQRRIQGIIGGAGAIIRVKEVQNTLFLAPLFDMARPFPVRHLS